MSTLAALARARKPYNWRLLLILIAAILVSVILITPYSLALQANSLEAARLPLPLPLLLPVQWIEAAVLYGIIAAIGLAIARRLGRCGPHHACRRVIIGRALIRPYCSRSLPCDTNC